MLLVILLYAISASTFLIGKTLLTFASPIFITGARTLLAGFFMLIFLQLKKEKINLKNNFWIFLKIAFFSFFLANTLKFMALQYLTSQQASLLSITEPIFALFISYFLFSEQIKTKKILYLLICISGIVISQSSNLSNFSLSLYSVILLAAIAFSAMGAILMRFFLINNNYSPVILNSITMLMGGLMSLSSLLILETRTSLNFNNFNNFFYFIGLLLIMILISNIFAYNLYGMLLKKYSVMFISCASFLRPFFVSLYNYLLFGEYMSLNLIFSSGIIFLGLYLLYKEESIIKQIII